MWPIATTKMSLFYYVEILYRPDDNIYKSIILYVSVYPYTPNAVKFYFNT